MLIRHKGLELDVVTDAPFVGARIAAINCSKNCPGCFNQHLLYEPTIITPAQDIIEQIQSSISTGIIFGGLEWTEQPEELCELTLLALDHNLEVMIYTHMDLQEFLEKFPILSGLNIYLKCGEYKKDLPPYVDERYMINLASSNQKIYWLGN